MQNYVYTKPYSTLIIERQGKGFSEVEITNILQEVLPQLTQIHVQGLGHGAISADTLAQDQSNFKSVLLNNTGFANSSYVAPEQLQTGQISTSGDIYALGVTMIVLLTGQSPELLRNNNGGWNWQDDCFISDQLAGVLEQAIAIYPQYRFADAIQMLAAINSVNTISMNTNPQLQPTVIQTNPNNLTNNLQISDHQPTDNLQNNNNSQTIPTSLLIIIGATLPIFSALVVFVIVKLVNSPVKLQPISNNQTLLTNTPTSTPINIPQSTPTPKVTPLQNYMLGTWKGSFGLNQKDNSTIIITNQSGLSFTGILNTVGKKGGYFKIAIIGEIDEVTKNVIIREVKIISKPTSESWFLGVNRGEISSDFRTISGTGSDHRGNKYSWAFYKQG